MFKRKKKTLLGFGFNPSPKQEQKKITEAQININIDKFPDSSLKHESKNMRKSQEMLRKW